ncbi:oxidative stress survival, Svf1-like protein [Copromyces sp. CBS 386.78]|nr:oxidative stress survival, Svf1-like protein [Copromyces sp. CBS 386.78]
MFKWAQAALANVAGTKEPIYGPEAIKSVAEEAKTTPYTEATRDDLKWAAMESTCVETQCFYFMTDSGKLAFAQVIYSNVAGIRTTCQFNSKVFSLDGSKPHLWCSTPLSNPEFSEDKTAFYATDCAVELSEDGNSYTIKSLNDERSIVNVTVKRTAPGFKVGTSGTTFFGTDPANPWGSMRHIFWPRCVAEGTIATPDGPVDCKGRAMFVHALQGMKPHHAAAKWNFCDFQGPNYSAVLMQYTTPPSYGSTVVNVGGIVKDNEIIFAGAEGAVTHVAIKSDTENDWPAPSAVKFEWKGTTKDGKHADAVLEGELEDKLDRIDVMAEVPGFVKQIVAGAVGTKPYIYQYAPQKKKLTLKLKIGEEEISEEGYLFAEATFISE